MHPETAWKRWLFRVIIATLSKIVATPWLARIFDHKVDDEDFPFPKYPAFDDEGSATDVTMFESITGKTS
jgi:hypothetical protein